MTEVTTPQAPADERTFEHTHHEMTANGSTGKYRVTHFLDEDGRPSGHGKVEMLDVVHHGNGQVEEKYKATGANYQAFCAQVSAQYAEEAAANHAAREKEFFAKAHEVQVSEEEKVVASETAGDPETDDEETEESEEEQP